MVGRLGVFASLAKLTMREITASLFKAQCLALMDQVASDREPLVIFKRGRALVQLVPLPLQRVETPFGIGSGGRILGELVPSQGAL